MYPKQHLHKLILLALLLSTSLNCFAQSPKIKILASASMWADMTSNIAGDLATIETIVPVGGDPHIYEPTTSDAIKVSNADLILINGLTFEGWIETLIENSGTKAKTVLITKYVEPIASETYHKATDPHAWMSAKNGLLYCQAIYEALVDYDPANKDKYTSNYLHYKTKLLELDSYIAKAIETIPKQHRILITSHDAFKYYGNAYGLTLVAIQGISTEAEAQTSDMIRVSETLSKYKVPAVFIESTINPKMLKQIAADNNILVGGELFADSLGDAESEGSTYYNMLKHNTDIISSALTQTSIAELRIDQDGDQTYLYWILAGVLLLIMGIVFNKMNV